MKIKSAFAILAILCSYSAWAQQDINETVRDIVKNNVDLKAQRSELSVQRNDNAEANSLPAPELAFGRVWGHHGVGNKWDLEASQSFDWPGLYGTRSKAADAAYSAGEMAAAAAELEMAVEAKKLLLELVFLRKSKAIDHTLLQNLNEMRVANDKAFENGYITILDQRKLQIATYEMENEIASLCNREDEIIATLRSMGADAQLQFDGITAYPLEPVLSEDEYMQQVAEIDPMLLSQSLTSVQEGLNAKASSQAQLPTFSVGFQHQYELGDNFTGFTLGMSLPFFKKNYSRNSALLRQDIADASARATLAQRQAEITSQMRSMDTWRGRIENYNKVFGDNSYLTLLKKALDGGEISIIEYLNESNYFHQTTQVYLGAEYNYNVSLAWLNRYSLLSE